ncbi:MAG: hypothetical protein ACRDHS_04900 [Actinomycetota bacterium]
MAMQAPVQPATKHKETKRDAFLRLAARRTNVIMEKIRILSNCANPYAYEYTDDDVKKIFSAIEHELRLARTKFQQSRKTDFRLS